MTHTTITQADGFSGEPTLSSRVMLALWDWAGLDADPDYVLSPFTTLDELCGPYTDEERADLLMMLADEFEVNVPDVVAASWRTVEDVTNHVVNHRAPAERIGG